MYSRIPQVEPYSCCTMRGTTKSRVSSTRPTAPDCRSDLFSHLQELQERIDAQNQTNIQQAEILAELQQQRHSELCECLCDSITSEKAQDAHVDTLLQLVDQSQANKCLIRQEESAMHEERYQFKVKACQDDAEIKQLQRLYRPWQARVEPFQRASWWVTTSSNEQESIFCCFDLVLCMQRLCFYFCCDSFDVTLIICRMCVGCVNCTDLLVLKTYLTQVCVVQASCSGT